MSRLFRVSSAVAAAAASVVLAAPAGAATTSPIPPRPAGSTTIPVLVTGGKKTTVVMYAPVTIAGRPAMMIVDTGAEQTTIDSTFAKQLALPGAGRPSTASTIGCSTKSQPVTAADWSVGGVPIPVHTLSAIPLSDHGKLTKIGGKPIVGLLGSDVLSTFGTATIDFLHKQLVLGGAFTPTPRTFGAKGLDPVDGRPSLITAPVQVGRQHYDFIIDTGAEFTVVDAAVTNGAHLQKAKATIPVGTVACATPVRPVLLTPWSIGGHRVPGTIAASRHTGLPQTTRKAAYGLIGTDILGHYGQVVIDYANLQVGLGFPPAAP